MIPRGDIYYRSYKFLPLLESSDQPIKVQSSVFRSVIMAKIYGSLLISIYVCLISYLYYGIKYHKFTSICDQAVVNAVKNYPNRAYVEQQILICEKSKDSY